MNKRILVTGVYGLIGLQVCKDLLSQGYSVIAIDSHIYHSKIVNRKNYCHQLKNKYHDAINIFDIDLTQKENLKFLLNEKIDAIIHLAAFANIKNSLERPNEFLYNNHHSTLNIFDVARDLSIPIIYASSSSVYGDSKNFEQSESDILLPISPYAQSKLENEHLAYQYYHDYDVKSIGCRFFTVYGPWNRPDMFIYQTLEKIAKDQIITLYKNGLIYRDFTFVEDITKNVLRALQQLLNNSLNHEILNIGSGNPRTVLDIVNIFEEKFNKKAIISYSKDKPYFDASGTRSSTKRRVELLGNLRFESLESGLSKVYEWYMQNEKKNE